MRKLLVLLSVAMIFALVACVQIDDDDDDFVFVDYEKFGGHLDIASCNISGKLDPCNADDAYIWTNLIWESPLSRHADGSIAPGVCEFELSEDQLVLKLWVREGITFHDDSPVEIEDVVASMLRRGHKSATEYVVDYLAEEPTIDADGVATFRFKEYSEKTMYYIASVKALHPVLPKEFVEKYPGTTADGDVHNWNIADAIGTGPYIVVGKQDGQWLELENYRGYMQPDDSLTGAAGHKSAYFDSIKFWNMPNRSEAFSAFDDGQIDAIDDVFRCYCLHPNRYETAALGAKTYFLLFNNMNQENQVHDDVNLRKAICAAIDFPELNEAAWDNGYLLGGIPCLDNVYYNDAWDTADYMGPANVELARQYLAKSNYKSGDRVYYIGYDPFMADLLKRYLNAAGIEMEIDIKDATLVNNRVCNGNAYWNFTFWSFDAGNTPSTISTDAYNRAWVSSAKDACYDVITATIPGSPEYMEAWNTMADLWVDECVAVYVGTETQMWTHHKDLVIDYEGADIYLWNSYWNNPLGHFE